MAIYINRKSNSDIILYLVLYAGGNIFSYQKVINKLNIDVTIATLSPPGHLFSKNSEPMGSVNLLSAYYVNKIKSQPFNKIIFWGHSFGGIIACKIASNLLNENFSKFDVCSLLLTSVPPPNAVNRIVNFSTCMSTDKLKSQLLKFGYLREDTFQYPKYIDRIVSDFKNDLILIESFKPDNSLKNLSIVNTRFIFGIKDDSMGPIKITDWYSVLPKTKISILDGGHFFIFENIKAIEYILKEMLRNYAQKQ